jgi:hypothetical protein
LTSSAEVAATRTRRLVIIAMSSMLRMLVGSAIASSSAPSSMKRTGTAW